MFYYYVICIYLDFNIIHLSLHSHYPICTEEKKKKKKATDVKKSAAVEKSSRELRDRSEMKQVDYVADDTYEEEETKDQNKPKGPRSAWIYFSSANRDRIKEENPEAGFGEIVSLILFHCWILVGGHVPIIYNHITLTPSIPLVSNKTFHSPSSCLLSSRNSLKPTVPVGINSPPRIRNVIAVRWKATCLQKKTRSGMDS